MTRAQFRSGGVVFVALVFCYQAAAAPPGLIGYWTFDEGGGTVAMDSSGNGLDGTLNGNPQWVEGVLGSALDFDGSGDFVEIPHDPLLSLTEAITIAAWTNMRANASGEMAIVSKGRWGANDLPYELTETAGDVIFWQFYDDAGRDSCAPDSPPVAEWHHIAGTYDGAAFKCYVDGELADEWAYAGTMPENDAAVTIGRRSRGGTEFNGMIDDVAIYSRALEPDEIQSIMDGHLGENPLARGPDPRDGSMIGTTSTLLRWRPGDFASLHDVYVGTDPDVVAAATADDTDFYAGRLTTEIAPVGTADAPYPDGLVPGRTYYWRVDEVNDAHPDSPWTGDVWSFWVQPLIAYHPYPADGMKYVDPDQDLAWEAGMGTIFHQLVFGTSFEEVRDTPVGAWMTVPPGYDPGPMELDTTYYWRVDEFKGMTTDKGEVWSFTTRGEGGGVQAEYFAGTDLAGDPVLTRVESAIDHTWANGEIAGGLADGVSARWTADLEAPFTETYRFITTSDDGVRVWLDGRMIINNWTDHGTTDNSARVDLLAGQIYRLVMEYYENTGGAVAQLSWESDTLPRQIVPQGWLQLPVKATGPSPVHNAPHANQDPTLSWMPGDDATGHHVYFGDDAEAVAAADPSTAGIYRGQQAAGATTYNPGPLEWGKAYYWRVDEANPAGVSPGVVWCFTTADFVVIDDFERYNNEVGSRPFEVWVDGIGFTLPEPGSAGNGSNAAVGHDIWSPDSPHYNGLLMETAIVNSGFQSMPVSYDNTVTPFYSEIERTWPTPQDWTVNGVDTLVLHVRGLTGNGPDRLYVTLGDSVGRTATVTLGDDETVTNIAWTDLSASLSDFAGVDPAAITTMIVGVGDLPAPGGAGTLYFDDFRVTDAIE